MWFLGRWHGGRGALGLSAVLHCRGAMCSGSGREGGGGLFDHDAITRPSPPPLLPPHSSPSACLTLALHTGQVTLVASQGSMQCG